MRGGPAKHPQLVAIVFQLASFAAGTSDIALTSPAKCQNFWLPSLGSPRPTPCLYSSKPAHRNRRVSREEPLRRLLCGITVCCHFCQLQQNLRWIFKFRHAWSFSATLLRVMRAAPFIVRTSQFSQWLPSLIQLLSVYLHVGRSVPQSPYDFGWHPGLRKILGPKWLRTA